MLKPIDHLSVDVVPQAILQMPIAEAVGSSAMLVQDSDDLDYFVGVSYRLDDKIEIAVRQYRGFPADTVSIYIDRKINDVETLSSLIDTILNDLKIPREALTWERRDDLNFQVNSLS